MDDDDTIKADIELTPVFEEAQTVIRDAQKRKKEEEEEEDSSEEREKTTRRWRQRGQTKGGIRDRMRGTNRLVARFTRRPRQVVTCRKLADLKRDDLSRQENTDGNSSQARRS